MVVSQDVKGPVSAPAGVQHALHLRMQLEPSWHGRNGAADPLQRRQREPCRLLPRLNADGVVGEGLQARRNQSASSVTSLSHVLCIRPFRSMPGCSRADPANQPGGGGALGLPYCVTCRE